jgi:hypothetical protein
LTGWAAGGRFEYMVAPNWSMKAEYLYLDLGTLTQTHGENAGRPLALEQGAEAGDCCGSFSAKTSRIPCLGNCNLATSRRKLNAALDVWAIDLPQLI